MKFRKTYGFIIGLLFLTSCVVKSLHPFYTEKSIRFDENFLGKWEDSKKGSWTVLSFAEVITKENPVHKMKKDDLALYHKFKKSYYIERNHKEVKTIYLATPFSVNNQSFLDFYPFEYQEDLDDLLGNHTIFTHSLVKYDVMENGAIQIRWLDEDKVEALFAQKKIKIGHKKIGLMNEKYLLTASSEELEKFIEKYMNSTDEDKWDTSTKFTLKKINDN